MWISVRLNGTAKGKQGAWLLRKHSLCIGYDGLPNLISWVTISLLFQGFTGGMY